LLGALARRGVTRVLAEGGAGLAAGLLRAGLVDRLAWFHAPSVMGAEGRPAAEGLRLAALDAMPRFRRVSVRALGPDVLTEFEEVPPCSPGS
jgi:diaminohydroxyphosphoribosylaminopyrimidine deaminase/5-amino-6-(5-phosphoribosylamino)uracil reductase